MTAIRLIKKYKPDSHLSVSSENCLLFYIYPSSLPWLRNKSVPKMAYYPRGIKKVCWNSMISGIFGPPFRILSYMYMNDLQYSTGSEQ